MLMKVFFYNYYELCSLVCIALNALFGSWAARNNCVRMQEIKNRIGIQSVYLKHKSSNLVSLQPDVVALLYFKLWILLDWIVKV